MNGSRGRVDFEITSFLDGFQNFFHVKLAIWMDNGQKLCENSALPLILWFLMMRILHGHEDAKIVMDGLRAL